MNERVKFIAAYLAAEEAFADLCVRFEVSRKTGYKWVERYENGGVQALVNQSRAPLSHPHAVSDAVVTAILAARRKHPRWGPKKLLVVLRRQELELVLPAASTVGNILRKHGVAHKRKRIRRSSPYGDRLGPYDAPNAVWCADFKGHFPVADERCNPLTISDGYSRYLLKCHALRRTLSAGVHRVFEATFREFGLPVAIRTDNGPPFSSLAPGGLSRLAVWWIRLGIRAERIMPGRPDQNGRHERMHSTLKAETARPPRSSFRAQQRAFDLFREEYNQVRPHEALGQITPASVYQPSPRKFPQRLPEIEYPSHFQTAQVYCNGMASFRGSQWYLSNCLFGEVVGFEEVDDDRWKVHFVPVQLGLIDVRSLKNRRYRHFGVLIRTDGEIVGINGRRRRGRRRR